MARNELFFSPWKLLGLACFAFFGGGMIAALAMGVQAGERIRGLGFLRLLGQDGPFWFAILFGLSSLLIALAAIRRLVGGGVAAAIRYDGIELRGLFMARYIPWRSLDGLYLRTTRYGDQVHHAIRIESSCPPGGNALHHALASLSHGVRASLLAASDDEMRGWLADAETARQAALAPPRPRAPAHAPLPAERPRIGFGRRMG
jgi:hypothetical protein